MSERLSTGVERLDTLLDGGLLPSAAALIQGPAFMGKELLARRLIVANLKAGVPVIYVTTNQTTDEVREELKRLDPRYEKAEEKGLINFIDTYSVSIGAENGCAFAHYLDGALDLGGISVAANRVQKDIVGDHDHHVLVIDSLSTLIAHNDAQTAFRFLQTFVGRTRLAGACTVALVDDGMHADADMQMFKHVMNGMLLLRDNQGKPQLMAQGLGMAAGMAWVEYKFDATNFEITGSFAAGRIR